ncbi:hypothetical protein MOQ72_44045, partial [Saccharopolyspora sp. K220]|uniref:hypothetical protein n=1 Tax=Saccharopolyspora soli TaxID=2926618 RepID=UPI001F58F0D8
DQPANLAGWQPANLATSTTSGNDENCSSRGLPDWQAQSNPPPEQSPTNQRGEASGIGWATSSKNEGPGKSAGTQFLTQLAFPDGTGFGRRAVQALADHVDLLLISGWTEDDIAARITDATGAGKIGSWPGFARSKLESLRPLPAAKPATTAVSPWCGECGDPRDPHRERKCRNNVRMRIRADGSPCPCATTNAAS